MEQAPYRQNARPPSTHRPRTRRPLRMSARRWLETPRYVALALLASVAIPFGELNGDLRAKYETVAPRIERVEADLAWAALATIPVLALVLHRAWRRLPARRTTKRRHLVRSVLVQAIAAALTLLALVGIRPSSKPLLATTTRGDATGYVYRHEWGCGYEVAVNDGAYAVRLVAAIAPFECDAPTPRLELRERTIALVGQDGKDVGEWSLR